MSGCVPADVSANGGRAASSRRRSAALRRAASSDVLRRPGRRPGLLQRIEPRVKLVTLFGLLVAAGLVRHIPVLLAVYVGALVVAVASGLSPAFFVKSVWLFVPIFTGAVVLTATFEFHHSPG